MKKLLILFTAMGLIFTACEDANTDLEAAEEPEMVQQENAGTEEENGAMEATTIEFDEPVHDFGTIVKGNMVSHTFRFKNTGTAPLVISDIKTSCGCTTPQYTKDPVAPGETGEVEVKYNGSGSGNISKTITVYANTKEPSTKLTIKANVRDIDTNLEGPVKN